MRVPVFAIVVMSGLSLLLLGCGEKPIGQPCNFGWQKKEVANPNPPPDKIKVPDCDRYPECRPLQNINVQPPALNNDGCPVDCIQMPSLECENLICVATQIEGNSTSMNGRCWTPEAGEPSEDCPGANIRCSGYCTKTCLTDASCPKEYKCSAMAPFSTTLKCGKTEEDEKKWATECTASCTPGGTSDCPYSGRDADYSDCDLEDNFGCCACICYKYCPILSNRFCRKRSWDKKMFEDAITQNPICGK